MRSRPTAVLALLLVGALATPVLAAGPGFRFKIRDRVMAGEEPPALILMPDRTIKRLRLTLERDDGKRIVKKAKNLPALQERVFTWKQGAGKHAYRAVLTTLDASGQESTANFEFTVDVADQLRVVVDQSLDHLDRHVVVFTSNRPTAKVELSVIDKGGATVRKAEHAYGPVPAGDAVEAGWEPFDGEIMAIQLKVFDPSGFWAGVELMPYSVQFTTDGLQFENGKWDILPSERPKLDDTLAHIREEMDEVAKARGKVELRLYVAGYTDTVGSVSDNQRLSDKRARAIAGYFRAKGLKIPLYFQGFGESVLAVQTPDETPEPRNRRALFVLTNSPPGVNEAMPKARWTRL